MKLGWLLVCMCASSWSSLSGGILMTADKNLLGIPMIIIGTIGVVSYFICSITIPKIMDLDISEVQKVGSVE